MAFVFLDISGSTANVFDNNGMSYYDKVKHILKKYPDAKLVLWNHTLITDPSVIEAFLEDPEGMGGTDIQPIAAFILHYEINTNIIIITDGEINQRIVQSASQMLTNHKFNKVTFYLCSQNVSVGTAFSRNCALEVINLLNGQVIYGVSQEDIEIFDHLETIGTTHQFNELYERLFNYVQTQVRGLKKNHKNVLNIRKKLVTMSRKVISDRNKNKSKDNTILSIQMADLKEDEKETQCTSVINQMLKSFSFEEADELQRKISRLIKLTNGSLSNSFKHQNIHSHRAANAPVAKIIKNKDIANENEQKVSTCEFECPVSLEEGRCAILFKKGVPLLTELSLEMTDSSQLINSITNNPLILTCPSMQTILEKLFNRFDRALGVDVATDPRFNHIGPETRNELEDFFLICGDTRLFNNATDSAIYQLVAGGKKLGNANLWFTLIWYTIKYKIIKCEHLQDFLPYIENHLLYRLGNNVINASMTGLADAFNMRMKFCESVYFITAGAPVQNVYMKNNEALRLHLPYINVLYRLMDLLKWKIPDKSVKHNTLTSAVLSLLYLSKKITKHDLRTKIEALTRNSIAIARENICQKVLDVETSVDYIIVDGPVNEKNKQAILEYLYAFTENFRQLSVGSIQELAKRVGPQHAPNTVEFTNYEVELPPLYSWKPTDGRASNVTINEYTCRPTNAGWEKSLFEATQLTPPETMSSMKRYMEFVVKYNKLPTVDEYNLYMFNRICIHGRYASLDTDITTDYDETRTSYAPIFKKLSIIEAVKRYEKSVIIKDRIVMEFGN